VLARDLVATAAEPIDVRWPLRRLAEDYPMCWTFHVDGIFGATPEMLVRRERGLVTSRVLAGTIRRTGDDGATSPSPPPWPGRRRTSRSTSTPSARSPRPSSRTARR
jgi:hypothetical protein